MHVIASHLQVLEPQQCEREEHLRNKKASLRRKIINVNSYCLLD
jgi:hypothetical protein